MTTEREPTRRRANVVSICVMALNRRSGTSLQIQIADAVRSAILSGKIGPGTLLPSTRLLSEDLGVSRNVTSAAYERLAAEGLLLTAVGSGTRVTNVIPSSFASTTRLRLADNLSEGFGPRPLSALADRASDLQPRRYHDLPRPFLAGVPGIDQFPIGAWTALMARCWRDASVNELCRLSPGGGEELRTAIASHAATSRGAACNPESVLVVSGTQQGLDVTARALADSGDIVWMEEPGYLSARHAFRLLGLNVVAARVDELGLDVEHAIANLPPPRLIYVTPSHQYPLGGTLSIERRIALLEYADRVGAWIIEDDYDSEFPPSGGAVPCLQGLDASGRVIYLSSFNKTMFPGLRLGFAIVPHDLMSSFKRIMMYSDGQPTLVTQRVMGEFIAKGRYFSHIRRMRTVYAQRREELASCLATYLPGLELGVRDRGLHFVGIIPDIADDVGLARAALSSDIILTPLSQFYLQAPLRKGFLFGSAVAALHEIRPAVIQLSRSLPSLVN